jgi:hypothetical protein
MHTLFPVVTAIVPILPALFLIALLRKMRQHGRPDRAAEWFLGFWLACVATRAAFLVVWSGAPWWLQPAMVVPPVAAGFWFLASRIRCYPQAVFSPPTAYRITRCRGHR